MGVGVKTEREIQERIAQHERDLEGWAEDGRGGLTSLVPTEPDPQEREIVRRELRAAISVLEWVMDEDVNYNHAEAFCLMKYVDSAGNVEFIWNSRDGVTPFCVRSRQGLEARHVDWGADQRLPKHKPRSGDRIFRDMTMEDARKEARRRIDSMPDLAIEMFGSAEAGVEKIASGIFADRRTPVLIEVP